MILFTAKIVSIMLVFIFLALLSLVLIPIDSLMLISCSYAGAIFADACLKGLNGVPDIVECSFVQSSITELPFFASKVMYAIFSVDDNCQVLMSANANIVESFSCACAYYEQNYPFFLCYI